MVARILIFTTAYNEERTIGDVLDRIRRVVATNNYDAELLVVDDGSSDGTVAQALERDVTLIEHPKNLGPGAATQTGYKYAVRNNFDITVRLDADGQHQPEDIPLLLDPILEDEADIVIGSRYKTDTGYETTPVRFVGIHFYSWLISLITGEKVYDITSGFRALRIVVGKDHAQNLPSGIIAIDRGIREGLSKHRIIEVPVRMSEREYGSSYLGVGRLIKYPLYSAYSFIVALIRASRQ